MRDCDPKKIKLFQIKFRYVQASIQSLKGFSFGNSKSRTFFLLPPSHFDLLCLFIPNEFLFLCVIDRFKSLVFIYTDFISLSFCASPHQTLVGWIWRSIFFNLRIWVPPFRELRRFGMDTLRFCLQCFSSPHSPNGFFTLQALRGVRGLRIIEGS